jgi:hypothetical protein
MTAASIVSKQVKILCGKCGKRIRSVEATSESWVRAHCLKAGALDEWMPFINSNEHCNECKEGWLF